MDFAQRLTQLRNMRGLSKYQLAKDIGVNKQTISFWEDGINEPKISYAIKLADYFDVSTDYLLGRKEW